MATTTGNKAAALEQILQDLSVELERHKNDESLPQFEFTNTALSTVITALLSDHPPVQAQACRLIASLRGGGDAAQTKWLGYRHACRPTTNKNRFKEEETSDSINDELLRILQNGLENNKDSESGALQADALGALTSLLSDPRSTGTGIGTNQGTERRVCTEETGMIRVLFHTLALYPHNVHIQERALEIILWLKAATKKDCGGGDGGEWTRYRRWHPTCLERMQVLYGQ